MIDLIFFTRRQCHLCAAAEFVLHRLAQEISFQIKVVDIDQPANLQWRDLFDHHVPVLYLNGQEVARHRLDESELRSIMMPWVNAQ